MVENLKLLELAAQIITAHVGCTPVPSEKLPEIIGAVYNALAGCNVANEGVPFRIEIPASMTDYLVPGDHTTPAIPVSVSIRPDKIACLVCGEWFKLLRPHLKQAHHITEKEYRATYGLTKKYPLVAQNYSQFRAKFAKESGLGKK